MKKEYKIGLAGIVALVALFFGINFLKGKALFSNTSEYYVRFANAKELSKSSKVFVDGFEVGIVTDLVYDYKNPGNVIVEINVAPELILCQGTEIKLDAGLMGGCAMKITPAPINDKMFLPGDTLQGTNHMDMVAQASKMMPQLSEIVKKVDTLVSSLNRVINDPKLASILSNVEQVTADLTKTTEHLNTIVGHDLPQLAQTYNKVGENVLVITENFKSVDLQPTIASVNATIENVNAMVQQMHNTNGTLGALLYDRSLYNSLNKTVGSMDSLMTDIKSHPKRYVHFSIFGRKDK